MKAAIPTYALLLVFSLSAEDKYYIVKFSKKVIGNNQFYDKHFYSYPVKIDNDEYTIEDVKLALRYKANEVIGKKEVFVVGEANTLSKIKRQIKNIVGYRDRKNVVLKIGSRELKKPKKLMPV